MYHRHPAPLGSNPVEPGDKSFTVQTGQDGRFMPRARETTIDNSTSRANQRVAQEKPPGRGTWKSNTLTPIPLPPVVLSNSRNFSQGQHRLLSGWEVSPGLQFTQHLSESDPRRAAVPRSTNSEEPEQDRKVPQHKTSWYESDDSDAEEEERERRLRELDAARLKKANRVLGRESEEGIRAEGPSAQPTSSFLKPRLDRNRSRSPNKFLRRVLK